MGLLSSIVWKLSSKFWKLKVFRWAYRFLDSIINPFANGKQDLVAESLLKLFKKLFMALFSLFL
jgi:hypothetical protein